MPHAHPVAEPGAVKWEFDVMVIAPCCPMSARAATGAPAATARATTVRATTVRMRRRRIDALLLLAAGRDGPSRHASPEVTVPRHGLHRPRPRFEAQVPAILH